ncbi:MAG: hypothetical protein M3163_15105, partial [Actinomycetota bacterium]|nr:hypothetical protein [Actinomycetota bacterium]
MRTPRPYVLLAAALMAVYVLAAVALVATKDFDDEGPLSLHEPARTEPLAGAITPAGAAQRCFSAAKQDAVKVVGGEVRGRPYYACYHLDGDDGSVLEAKVVDGRGFAVTDAGLIKDAGAWPWIATVDNMTDLVFGALGLAGILWLGWLYGRRERPVEPTSPWWSRSWALVVLALIPFLGWIGLAALPGVERRRRARAAFQAVFIFIGFVIFGLLGESASAGDTWGVVVNGLLAGGLALAVLGSRTLRPVDAVPPPPAAEADDELRRPAA